MQVRKVIPTLQILVANLEKIKCDILIAKKI